MDESSPTSTLEWVDRVSLDGKIAVVTGASGDIGFEVLPKKKRFREHFLLFS